MYLSIVNYIGGKTNMVIIPNNMNNELWTSEKVWCTNQRKLHGSDAVILTNKKMVVPLFT